MNRCGVDWRDGFDVDLHFNYLPFLYLGDAPELFKSHYV